MRKLDENKLARLHTAGELLDRKYGETDIQISSFFRIARALGIEFTPTFL